MTTAPQTQGLEASRGACINVRAPAIKTLFSQGSESSRCKTMCHTRGGDLTQDIAGQTEVLPLQAETAASAGWPTIAALESSPHYLYITVRHATHKKARRTRPWGLPAGLDG